jgi:hypothetical protein
VGEWAGDGAGALADAGSATLVGLDAGEVAGEAGATREPVLPTHAPACLARAAVIA